MPLGITYAVARALDLEYDQTRDAILAWPTETDSLVRNVATIVLLDGSALQQEWL